MDFPTTMKATNLLAIDHCVIMATEENGKALIQKASVKRLNSLQIF
jgi:hypothetical protein